MVEDSDGGRMKRMVPGGNRQPKKQMVEVQRIYKGEKMMMPMMKLERDTDTPVDSFSAATKIEAGIQLGKSYSPYTMSVNIYTLVGNWAWIVVDT